MYRKLMGELVSWKNHPNRKPLLLRGARQTGKTWLVNEFAKTEYRDVIRIDFLLDEPACSLFSGNLDPAGIIRQMELRYGRRVNPEDTLIFFDEIQEAPRGLVSLKYFCEQAREYNVIAAGSYMGIAQRRAGESFPVGKVDELTLHPMSFPEFVRVVGGEPLADALDNADMDTLAPVGDVLERHLKEYLVVGGMPEVVESFAEMGQLDECRRLQLQILNDYDGDYAKHVPPRMVERVRQAWQSLPGQLARENKKFVYGAIRPGARARDFEESLQWLRDYGTVYKVPRVSALRLPLSGYEDVSAFKLFCSDVGLLGALAGLDPATVLEGSRLFTEFRGALTEQYVLQELVCQGFSPVYWSSDTGTAETDFAVALANNPVPIEVKAGENLRSKSLRVACEKFQLDRVVRTSLSPYRDEGWLVNVPLWAIGQIQKLA